MRENFLPFALPDLGDAEFAAVKETMKSGWITTGEKARRFEAEFASSIGAKHAIAVNSCTAALHLALEALHVQQGDIVFTTPFTFAATAEVIRYFNALPVFVDIEPDTLNIDAEKLKEIIDLYTKGHHVFPAAIPHTRIACAKQMKAIIPVHIAGVPADLDEIHAVAQHHLMYVIEDAAHAFPAYYKTKKIGSLSDFTCFSFYATKTITTGEGGMICTNNDAWAERCRIMVMHGISKNAVERYKEKGSWYYEILAPGYKYNLTDIAAAIGLVQLSKAEGMWQHRRAIAEKYNAAFSGRPELQIPANPLSCQHAWHLYILRLNLERLTIDRARFVNELKQRNVGTSVHFIPLHLHPYYRDTYGYQPEDFPVAYQQYQRVISLPIYSKMTDADVKDVIDAVVGVIDNFRR